MTLDLIVKEAHDRLRRLDLCDYSNLVIQPYLPSLRNAPCLQQLSLCFINPNIDQPFSSFGDANTDANAGLSPRWLLSLPSLTKLRLVGLCIPFIQTLTTLIAVNLRLSYHDAHILFSASPNLSSLTLDNLLPLSFPSPVEHSAQINAHSLSSITIRSEARVSTEAIYLFNLLFLPNLAYLHLDGIGAASISSIFGSLSGAPIETLRITCSQASFMGIPESNAHITVFHSLSTLQNLQIIHGPVELLSPTHDSSFHRARTRSIQSREPRDTMRPILIPPIGIPHLFQQRTPVPSTNSVIAPGEDTQTMPWPNLHTIRLDSLLATDVASLCEFITRHKGVRAVELSHSAMRHLSGSLLRKGDQVFIPWRGGSNNSISHRQEGTKDVQEWLANQVTLMPIISSNEYERLNSRGASISLFEMI